MMVKGSAPAAKDHPTVPDTPLSKPTDVQSKAPSEDKSWVWPDPQSEAEAVRISRRGVWGLAIIGLLTLFGQPPVGLLLGCVFLLLALGIHFGHATAAVAGMLVAVSPVVTLLLNRGPHWATFLLSGLIQCLLIAYFPFVAFRALRMAEQFRSESGGASPSSLAPGLLLWLPLSAAVLAFYLFVTPNLYPIPEDVPGRGLLAGDIVLLEPTSAPPPATEAARKVELARRARRIIWSFHPTADELKTGQFSTWNMYATARRERILQPIAAPGTH